MPLTFALRASGMRSRNLVSGVLSRGCAEQQGHSSCLIRLLGHAVVVLVTFA